MKKKKILLIISLFLMKNFKFSLASCFFSPFSTLYIYAFNSLLAYLSLAKKKKKWCVRMFNLDQLFRKNIGTQGNK